MGCWREQQNVSAMNFQILTFERLYYAQNDLSHRWIWPRWLPCLCAALSNGRHEITKSLPSIGIERSDWKHKIGSVACDGLVSAMCRIERDTVAPGKLVKSTDYGIKSLAQAIFADVVPAPNSIACSPLAYHTYALSTIRTTSIVLSGNSVRL